MIDPNHICYQCMSPLPEKGEYCMRCGAKFAQLQNQPCQLPIGSILAGKYLAGCALGQGGFGITYIGWDLNLDKRLAIKEYFPEGFVSRDSTTQSTVLPHTGELGAFFQKGRSKFVDEAKVLAKFATDPGIVTVHDFFNENGTAYIVMDYVEGKTLKQLAAEHGGRLPTDMVLNCLRPIMDSLEKVHAVGLLHRDISPDNIMIRPDGSAVLLDFGAAREVSAAGERSNTINVKHGYAPEEQYRTHGEQGPWTDIYALCATIYRLTTGSTPPQAMDRAMSDLPLTPPNLLGAQMNEAQQAAIMQGMSVRGRERQQNMRQLEDSLYGGVPPQISRPSTPVAGLGKGARAVQTGGGTPVAGEVRPASEHSLLEAAYHDYARHARKQGIVSLLLFLGNVVFVLCAAAASYDVDRLFAGFWFILGYVLFGIFSLVFAVKGRKEAKENVLRACLDDFPDDRRNRAASNLGMISIVLNSMWLFIMVICTLDSFSKFS